MATAPNRPRVLMCRPTHYGVRYVINPWMRGHVGMADNAKAMTQWQQPPVHFFTSWKQTKLSQLIIPRVGLMLTECLTLKVVPTVKPTCQMLTKVLIII